MAAKTMPMMPMTLNALPPTALWRAMIRIRRLMCMNFARSLPSRLASLIMLRPGDAFIDQSFIIASPFVVLIVARSRWHFVSGRAVHWIPAFGFGC